MKPPTPEKRKPRQRTYLKQWRKHRGLTQEALAELVQVDRSYISMIECGRSGYTQLFLEAAAEALGIEPADLLVRNPEDPTGYWHIWDGLHASDRPVLAAMAETLSKQRLKTGS